MKKEKLWNDFLLRLFEEPRKKDPEKNIATFWYAAVVDSGHSTQGIQGLREYMDSGNSTPCPAKGSPLVQLSDMYF